MFILVSRASLSHSFFPWWSSAVNGAVHHTPFALCSGYGDSTVESPGQRAQRETYLHLLVKVACYGVSRLHATSMQPHPAMCDTNFCSVLPEWP